MVTCIPFCQIRKKILFQENSKAFLRTHSPSFHSELNAKSRELHLQISDDGQSSEGGCSADRRRPAPCWPLVLVARRTRVTTHLQHLQVGSLSSFYCNISLLCRVTVPSWEKKIEVQLFLSVTCSRDSQQRKKDHFWLK